MFARKRSLLLIVLLFSAPGIAKDKKKIALSDFVLNARTVLVLIDPDAGTPVNAPMTNKTAQEDVEKAIQKWGRFAPALNFETADLIIIIRKGSDKIVQPVVTGEPTNNRPIIVQQSDSGIRVGGQQGRPPDGSQSAPQDTLPKLGNEIGPSEDMFQVYIGHVDAPTERAPVWRYNAKNALKSPDVPAVAEFRKAIEAALKQAKSKP